eukprot:10174795-Karenia_brevis.AAC.1
MATLKLNTSSDRPEHWHLIGHGATLCHCPPFSQAEMAAQKLNILKQPARSVASHQTMALHAATAHPSHMLKWLH